MRCPISLYAGQNTNWRELKDHLIALGGVEALVVRVDPATLRKVREEGVHEHVRLLIWVPVINGIPPERLYLDADDAVSWTAARRAEIIAAGLTLTQVALHLHNETAIVKAAIDWEVVAVRAGLPFGMKFAVIGASVGTPTQEQMKLYRPLLQIAIEAPDSVILSLHLYFSVLPQRKADLYSGRWRDWIRVADQLGLKGQINVIATEYGAENIPDDHEWTRTLPGWRDGFGPVHTLGAAWNQLLGDGKSMTQQYAELVIEGWEQVLAVPEVSGNVTGQVLAAAVFGVGLDDRWDDYDVWALGSGYRTAIETWNREREPMSGKIKTLRQPTGEIGAGTKVKLLIARNLRYGPEDETYDAIRLVQPDTELVIYKATGEADPPYIWYWLLDLGTGDNAWIAENAAGPSIFEEIAPPEEPEEPGEPETPPITLPEDWQAQVKAMLREIVIEEMGKNLAVMLEMMKATTMVQMRRAASAEAIAEVELANYGILKEAEDRIVKLVEGDPK